MKVSSIQLEIIDRSKDENIKHALSMLDRLPDSDLILLPEIWSSGYFSFDRYQAESEPVDGPTVTAFSNKAVERRCHILMGSFVENDGGHLYNTTLLLDPDGNIAARYRKIHLFGYQSDEKKILTSGQDIVVVDTPWGPSGFSTCYDLRSKEKYPSRTFSTYGRPGGEVLSYSFGLAHGPSGCLEAFQPRPGP